MLRHWQHSPIEQSLRVTTIIQEYIHRMDGLDTLSTSVPSLDSSSIKEDAITNTSAPSSCRFERFIYKSKEQFALKKSDKPNDNGIEYKFKELSILLQGGVIITIFPSGLGYPEGGGAPIPYPY